MVKCDGDLAVFRFYRPTAKQVHLAGDFNGWREGELPMMREEGGYWTAKLRLPSGEFKFRYCVDGEWFADYAAFGLEPGRYGLDSIVRVEPKPLRLAPAATEADSEIVAA